MKNNHYALFPQLLGVYGYNENEKLKKEINNIIGIYRDTKYEKREEHQGIRPRRRFRWRRQQGRPCMVQAEAAGEIRCEDERSWTGQGGDYSSNPGRPKN